MRVAFGLKAHSGWSALVVIGVSNGEIQVVDRRRIELIDPADAASVGQPYHAAEHLNSEARATWSAVASRQRAGRL